MKNSILGKARWLREVALATSKNNGARVAHEWLKYAAMFVMLLTLGSGNAWGAAATLPVDYSFKDGKNSLPTGVTQNGLGSDYAAGNAPYRLKFDNNDDYIQIQVDAAAETITIGVKEFGSSGASIQIQGSADGSSFTNIQTLSFSKGQNKTSSQSTSSSISSSYRYFRVKRNSGSNFGLGTLAITKVVAPCTKIDAPTVTATPGDGRIDLSWSNQTGASSYSVTKTPSGGSVGTPSKSGSTWSCAITGLMNGTTYTWSVEAVGSGDYCASDNTAASASATPNVYYTVTWKNNGSEYTTTSVASGQKPTFPSNPSSCDGTSTTFYGWSTSEWSGKLDDVSAKTIYTSGSAMPNVSGPVTYHAVFAKETSTLTPVPNTWTRITSTSQLTDGATVMLVHYSKYAINNTLGATSCTANAEITNNSTDLRWIAVKSDSKWKFKTSAGKYLSTSATADNTTLSLNQTYDEWTISADAGGYSNCFNLNNGNDLEYFKSTFKLYKWSSRYSSAYPFYIYIQKTTGSTTYSQYLTTCQACAAPTSVTITGTNKYLGGQTISLTATPEGGTGTPSYQWQKKISEAWTNLENDGSISGVTSNNLKISSCSYVNSGGYRCIVSTGDGCETKSHADDTNGYGVHVFSIYGRYYNEGDWVQNEITWTSGTTGTATIHLSAKKTYTFKIRSNNDLYYGYSSGNFIIQPATNMDCGTGNSDIRLFTGPEGDYTFTVDIQHGLDGSPYITLQVGYPTVSHPNTGYVYVQKFNWRPYLHYWYDNSNVLSEWGSDPQLNSDQYTSICGTEYWYIPVIDYYCNFIAKDAAGNPSNTTGDQHTNSPHPGQRLYNDGSWKWGEFSTYTIAYAGGDGSTGGPMASHTGLCPGSSQQLTANAFSKSGYNFSGWTANVDVKIGGSTVPAGTLITGTPIIENVQSNITLTAQWTATTYTITYNGVKTGAENTNPTSYTVEDLPINLVAATHDQWRFDGWTDDNAGNADITTIPAGTTGNQSFTAHWTQRYAVTWYEESTPTVTYFDPGATLQFPADPSAPASCSEKKFVGWMVGTIEGETDDKPTFITAGEVNADAAYHAVWANSAGSAIAAVEDNTFTQSDVSKATYCGVGNGLQSVGKYVQNQSIWNASQMTGVNVKIKVYHVSNNRADVLRISLINSSGEEVVGTDLTTSKLGNSSSFAGYSSNVTLTPTTAVTGYKVSLKTKNSSGTSVGKVTREVVPAYSKYSTSCCDNNVAAPSVTATATRNSITLSWANVTGATGYKVTINGGTHDVTTAACTYTESGLTSGTDYAWTVIATYNPANYCGAIPTKNTTTTLSVYGVTYNKNTTIGSGTVTMSPMPSDASTYVVGENVTAAAKPATCTNSGYTFNGWNTEPDGTGTHVDAGGTIAMVEGGLTLYAEWVAKRAYYVDRMHGQGDQTIEIGGKTYHCYYGDGYHITPSPSDQKSGDACQAPHYRFVRWLTIGHINADGTQKDTGGAVSGGVQRGTVTDGETYYAIWEEEIE